MTLEMARGMVACVFALTLFISVGGALVLSAYLLITDARLAEQLSNDKTP